MFRIDLGRTGHYCDGMQRRSFLQLGVAGMASLGLSGVLRAREESAKSLASKKNTKVILIWLDGGPGHMDMYDMKPEAAAEYRGSVEADQDQSAGLRHHRDVSQAGEDHRQVFDGSFAASRHRRPLCRRAPNADGEGHGRQRREQRAESSPASARSSIANSAPRETGLPGYVAIPYGMSIGLRPGYFGGHMLGAQHNPFETINDAASPNFKVPNLELAAGPDHRQARRPPVAGQTLRCHAQATRRTARRASDGSIRRGSASIRSGLGGPQGIRHRQGRPKASRSIWPAPVGPKHVCWLAGLSKRVAHSRRYIWAAGTITGT